MENNAENKTEKKKIIFSGIQPTGCITLGNYIGALKNWVDLQNDYNCLFSVVDLHSITVRQDSALLRKRCIEFLVQYLALSLIHIFLNYLCQIPIRFLNFYCLFQHRSP